MLPPRAALASQRKPAEHRRENWGDSKGVEVGGQRRSISSGRNSMDPSRKGRFSVPAGIRKLSPSIGWCILPQISEQDNWSVHCRNPTFRFLQPRGTVSPDTPLAFTRVTASHSQCPPWCSSPSGFLPLAGKYRQTGTGALYWRSKFVRRAEAALKP